MSQSTKKQKTLTHSFYVASTHIHMQCPCNYSSQTLLGQYSPCKAPHRHLSSHLVPHSHSCWWWRSLSRCLPQWTQWTLCGLFPESQCKPWSSFLLCESHLPGIWSWGLLLLCRAYSEREVARNQVIVTGETLSPQKTFAYKNSFINSFIRSRLPS